MKFTKWCGVVALAAPALTQETPGCDCSASTVTQSITVTGPTVTVTVSSCPDTVSAVPAAVSSTKPYICAGDPCTSWVDNHSPGSTDILTFKPTTVTQYPVPPTDVSATPTIHLTSTRTKTYTVKTRTTVTASCTDDCDEDDTSTITAAPVTQTPATSEQPEPTTTTTEFSTVTERATITFTHASSTVVTTIHLSSLSASSHRYSFTGFGSHGWNLTSSTARLNGTAQTTHRRPSHGGYHKSSAKWHTVTLPWTASHNTSSAQPHKTSSVESISWDLGFSTPIHSHNKTSSAKPHKTSSVESISWDLGPDTSIFPLTTSTIWDSFGTPTHHHKTSSHSWKLQFSSTPITHIPSAIHHTSSQLATPYANTTSVTFVKRIATVAQPSPTECPVPQDERGNFTFSYKESPKRSVEDAAVDDQVKSANHLSANGYVGLGSSSAFIFMQRKVTWYEEAHSVFPGGIGVGADLRHLGIFMFDAFHARFGCLNSPSCEMRAIGYKLNSTDGTEVEGASQRFPGVVSCSSLDCKLTPVTFSDEFRNLTSIVFLASSTDGEFLMEGLGLGWKKQDCDSGMERYFWG